MDLPVDDFLDNLNNSGEYSDNTLQAYSNDIHQFAEYLQQIYNRIPNISDYNLTSIASYIDHQRQDGRQRSTLLRRRASLCTFGRFLSQQNLIDDILTTDQIFVPPKPRRKIIRLQRPKALNDKQIQRLFQVLQITKTPRSLRDFAMINLLLETGISIGIMVAIDLEDLDLIKNRVFVTPHGSKRGYWVWINYSLKPIEQYLNSGRINLTDSRIETALFVSQMGGRMSRQAIWKALTNWGAKAKLKFTLSPRIIRNTAAIRLRARGLSIAEIQRLLGHSNPVSTRALLRRLKA